MLSNWKAEHWAIAICVSGAGLLCVALVMEHVFCPESMSLVHDAENLAGTDRPVCLCQPCA